MLPDETWLQLLSNLWVEFECDLEKARLTYEAARGLGLMCGS
jgi:hypothetical protein